MKIIKKISAIVASALMVGMSMGVAAAQSYPAPFIAGSSANVAIVVGTGTGVSPLDGLEAGAINSNLQSYATGTSSGQTLSGSGGDLKILSSSARNLYYGDAINAAIPTLTNSELPTVLAAGTFTDLQGTNYGYTQTIKVGPAVTVFGTSQGDLADPKLYLDTGNSNTTSYVYNYTLSFNKNVNTSDAVNVIGQPITIMGQTFVIGSGSTGTTLYLNGAGQDVVVNGGDTATVTIGGISHTIKTVTTASTTQATISVDGVTKDVVEGSTYTFTGNLNVYVKSVVHPAFQGDTRYVEMLIGSSSLKLVDGQTVKKGTDATSIQGTLANIASSSGTQVSGFTVQIAANSSIGDYVLPGGSFVDPVFGAVKVSFVDAVPDLSSAARGKVEFSADGGTNPQFEYLTFTSARAGSAGEKKLTVAYDNNTATTAIQPVLAHQVVSSSTTTNGGFIHVLEGQAVARNDWVVLDQGDLGTIVSFDSFDVGNGLTGNLQLTDVVTGQSQTITLTNQTSPLGVYTSSSATLFGGTGYNVQVNTATTSAGTLNITWNSGTVALFPRIKLANGGWIALLQDTTVANATNLLLPNGKTSLDTSGTAYGTGVGTAQQQSTVDDGIGWVYSNATLSTVHVWGLNSTSTGLCNFSSTAGPALLIMEPKKYGDASYGDFICIPNSPTATTAMSITDAQFNGTNSGLITLQSDSYQKQAVDKFGALVVEKTPTNTNGDVTVTIPNSQMYFDLAFASPGTVVTPNVAAGPGASIGSVEVLDSQVSTVQGKNLIVIGGSCINSVAANLVGGAKCTSDWTTATGVGSGQFLIQSFASPYTTGQIALLVAGYDAQDTVNAATYLMNKSPDVSSGKKYVGTDAQTAQLVVASS